MERFVIFHNFILPPLNRLVWHKLTLVGGLPFISYSGRFSFSTCTGVPSIHEYKSFFAVSPSVGHNFKVKTF